MRNIVFSFSLAAVFSSASAQTFTASPNDSIPDDNTVVIYDIMVSGLPNKLVADQLDISVRTVEVHRARVFDKMGVKSAVELANLLRNL